ncbi:ABC transporter permease [Tunturiibacter lichenicola]|uniref:ABC transporter permease n=1 Tax=Tunturiibacter lichenicola TaxID=2051959 RepID=UPI0021B213AB|nr:ABC transporter permease [Edaphobacter lichenicola]
MRKLRALWQRLCGTFNAIQADRKFADELESHLQMHMDDNLRAGMSPQEARRQALIRLGGIDQTRQAYRERQTLPWIEPFWQDIRFGLRMLWKSPAFTAIAVITLALGIGAHTAIFSIVNGVLLNPLPFPHPEQLVILHASKENFEFGSVSYPNFQDWQKSNHSFSSMALSRGYNFSLTGTGEAEQLNGQFMTSGFFETLGVKPILGRTFTQAEEQPSAEPVVLISESLWKRKFGASSEVLNKRISLEGRSYAIIGVIPASFHLAVRTLASRDVYVPIGQWRNPALTDRGAGMGMRGIARLRLGVSIEQANADMARVSQNLASAFPDADKGVSAKLVPLKEQLVGNVRPFLVVLMAAVGFVLLIACVNVASLMLARSTSRTREFAVRTALGASRLRMIRQLLTESLLLAFVGGALGLMIALWATHTGLRLLPEALPRAEEIGVDLRVLLFTMALSLLTGTLFGLIPALKTSHVDPHTALKEGGRGASGTRHPAQSAFVIAEMAIALVLLAGAGLMVRSLKQLWSVDPGFNPRNVFIFGYTLPPSMINGNPGAIRAAYRNFDQEIAMIPGVEAVSQSWGGLPMEGDDDASFWLDGQPRPTNTNEMSMTLVYNVGPDYAKAMGVSLKRGRFFTVHDDERSPLVGVIDEVFAKKYFPDQNPIGKRVVLNDGARKMEIVGVVGHVNQWGLDADDDNPLRVQLYTSWMQTPDDFVRLAPSGIDAVVRYTGNLTNVSDAIRHNVQRRSSEQILYDAHTMESSISDSLAERRFAMILLAIFAGLALLLAGIGIYGVIAYLVEQRTQEIGIRMALGAQRAEVARLMLWEGTRLALMGVAIGVAAGLALTRLMTKMIYGVSATDPLTFSGVAMVLMLVAIAACYFPARKASRLDPIQSLRSE